MKIWDIAKKVGSAALQVALPGAGTLIVNAVNEFMPDDKKLPVNATGSDVVSAIEVLPPEQRVKLMDKEFDVQITDIKESNETLRVMLESDAKNPHSTRPYIAKGSFHIVAFVTTVIVLLWAYAVGSKDDDLVEAGMSGSEFVVALVAPFVILLWAYFGILKQEQQNKLNAANSLPANGLGLVGSLASKLLGKK